MAKKIDGKEYITGTVTFVDASDEVLETLKQLSKTALRESAKTVRKILRDNLPIYSNRLKNHIGSWVLIEKNTGRPKMQIGFYSWKKVIKKGKLPSHANPHWLEFGTSPAGGKKRTRKLLVPKKAKVLAYNDTFYGKKVVHPGFSEPRILRNTAQDNIDKIRKAQEKYLSEITKTIEEAKRKVYTGEDVDEGI